MSATGSKTKEHQQSSEDKESRDISTKCKHEFFKYADHQINSV